MGFTAVIGPAAGTRGADGGHMGSDWGGAESGPDVDSCPPPNSGSVVMGNQPGFNTWVSDAAGSGSGGSARQRRERSDQPGCFTTIRVRNASHNAPGGSLQSQLASGVTRRKSKPSNPEELPDPTGRFW